MKKIRVLETIRQGKIGGGESHVLDLSLNLDKEKYAPIVLSFTSGPMIDLLKKRKIIASIIYTESAFDFKIWKKVKEFIVKEKIDIIHAHGTRAMSNVFWAAKKLNIPIIYTVHGWSFHLDQKFLVRKVRESMEKYLTSKATKTICVSYSNQKDGETLFNLKRSTVIYNAVDFEKFNLLRSYKDIRTELNIAKDKTLIGYIVRVTGQKDPFTMVQAMKIVAEREKNIVLLMVGDGDLKDQIVQMAKDLNLGKQIVFQPFRTDVPDLLNAIDIYCLPSLWEGFPIGIIEAMAMKKTVVASPVDGNSELVEDGKTGITVPIKDSEKLANVLIDLHNDNTKRTDLANAGYNFITQNFGIKRMVDEIEKLYYSVHSNK